MKYYGILKIIIMVSVVVSLASCAHIQSIDAGDNFVTITLKDGTIKNIIPGKTPGELWIYQRIDGLPNIKLIRDIELCNLVVAYINSKKTPPPLEIDREVQGNPLYVITPEGEQ